MAIDIETFENDLDDSTNAERVLRFLAANDDKAFTRSEVADGAGVREASVSTVLSRLKDRGLVRHRGEYWAITDDDDRLRSFADYRNATSLFNDRLGAEDVEEWREHAPDEPHPSEESP